MKLSDGLFIDQRPAASRDDYINITYDERIVDAACMQLVMHPEQFDVLVLPNCTATSCPICAPASRRGSEVVARRNLGSEIGVFERCTAARRTSRQTSGEPQPCCSRRFLMLRHIDEATAADRIMQALGAC